MTVSTAELVTPSAPAPVLRIGPPPARTIWGLDPQGLHHRCWAAHGVQVVRQGEPSEIVSDCELYLLTDPRSLVLFKMSSVIDVLNWIKPQVLLIRLHDDRERGYREKVITDNENRFIRVQRLYRSCVGFAAGALRADAGPGDRAVLAIVAGPAQWFPQAPAVYPDAMIA